MSVPTLALTAAVVSPGTLRVAMNRLRRAARALAEARRSDIGTPAAVDMTVREDDGLCPHATRRAVQTMGFAVQTAWLDPHSMALAGETPALPGKATGREAAEPL